VRSLRLLIADDEPLIRLGVRRALGAVNGIEIVRECGSGDEAVDAIESLPLDLVILDVQMPGCSGLDVVRRVGPPRMPAVIFLTAYDDYAVQAFEVNAVDYVLKPFDPERLQESIERARTRLAGEREHRLTERLEALLASRADKWPDRLVIRSGDRFEFVPLTTIDWIEAADNYAKVHCGSKYHLLGETLTSLERRLDPRRFLRIHRSRIVNTSRVVAIRALVGGAYELELRDGTRLTSGRQYRESVQQFIRA
jgi:two-component system, LytTR family, response regulator